MLWKKGKTEHGLRKNRRYGLSEIEKTKARSEDKSVLRKMSEIKENDKEKDLG